MFSKLFEILTKIYGDPMLVKLLKLWPRHSHAGRVIVRAFIGAGMAKARSICERTCFRRPRRGFTSFKARGDILRESRSIHTFTVDASAFEKLPSLPRPPVKKAFNFPPRIRIASQYIPFSREMFSTSYQDPEDTMAAHRFVWLLMLMQEHGDDACIRFGLQQIEFWCGTVTETASPLAFETYTICERLIAWLHFLMLPATRDVPDPLFYEKLARSYRHQLAMLASHLEYNGSTTNNHILNNARALYICGAFLGIETIAHLGRKILREETDRFIVSGTLQENSSHYQMLITKSFLEIYSAARHAGDTPMVEWLTPRVREMLAVCNVLHSKENQLYYPLFGDISPDCDPDWIAGYPFCCDKDTISKWYEILPLDLSGLTRADTPLSDSPCNSRGGWQSDGWHYLNGGGFEVWLITKKGIKCHGHNDSASINLSYRGEPIVVDIGLVNYSTDIPLAIFQSSSAGHNTPLLNGLPPDFEKGSFYNRTAPSATVIESLHTSLQCRLHYLSGLFILHRTITLPDQFVVIRDSLPSGVGTSYQANWFFNSTSFPVIMLNGIPCSDASSSRLTFSIDSTEKVLVDIQLKRQQSTRYGESKDVYQVRIEGFLSPSNNITYTISAGKD